MNETFLTETDIENIVDDLRAMGFEAMCFVCDDVAFTISIGRRTTDLAALADVVIECDGDDEEFDEAA